MLMDAATANEDLHWFCRRFTSFRGYRVEERGHPLRGELWIDHPFVFWLTRIYQEWVVDPQEGWLWVMIHRIGLKTTLALALILWIHARDEMKTVGLWTHQVEKIGSGMGRGALAELQTDELRDHYPQFRRLREGTNVGYVLDRPPGPRDQSLAIRSILTDPESVHPDGLILFDDIVTTRLRGNVEQIAKIAKNLSAVAAVIPPETPVIVCNTPKDAHDPLMARLRAGEPPYGLFGRVVRQAAMQGGDFTPAGEPNLHTRAFYQQQRRQINDDSIYFPEYELEFRESAEVLLSWEWIRFYEEAPEELARRFPYVNIIVDGAKGEKKSDFTVIRVITWTGPDSWANLELIRERVGASKAMQILLGRDRTDSTSGWLESGKYAYCPGGLGLVERWMRVDPRLTVWFDDHANSGWLDNFREMIRLRGVRFSGGRPPTARRWPELHRPGQDAKNRGTTKRWKIGQLEVPYQQGRVAYPKAGFRHGSYAGLAGPDDRDTLQQFKEDEFERLALGGDLPFDDMLDTEAVINLPQAQEHMRRPAKRGGLQVGGKEFPRPTIRNPFGLPGQNWRPQGDPYGGRTWQSM